MACPWTHLIPGRGREWLSLDGVPRDCEPCLQGFCPPAPLPFAVTLSAPAGARRALTVPGVQWREQRPDGILGFLPSKLHYH